MSSPTSTAPAQRSSCVTTLAWRLGSESVKAEFAAEA